MKSNNLQYNKLAHWVDGTNDSSTKGLMLNWNNFCKELCKKFWKKMILGTSDAWLMSRLFHRPSEPAYYIVDWRISSHELSLVKIVSTFKNTYARWGDFYAPTLYIQLPKWSKKRILLPTFKIIGDLPTYLPTYLISSGHPWIIQNIFKIVKLWPT